MTHEVTAVDVEAFGLRLTEALRPLLVGAPLIALGEAEGVMASLARDVRQLGEARLAADPADRTGLAYVATAAAVQRVVDVLAEAPTAAPGSAPTPAGPARRLLVPLRLPDEVPIPSRAYHIAGTVTGMRDTLRHLRSLRVSGEEMQWLSRLDWPLRAIGERCIEPAASVDRDILMMLARHAEFMARERQGTPTKSRGMVRELATIIQNLFEVRCRLASLETITTAKPAGEA